MRIRSRLRAVAMMLLVPWLVISVTIALLAEKAGIRWLSMLCLIPVLLVAAGLLITAAIILAQLGIATWRDEL